MKLSPIARIKTAIDILRGRLPGALAMFKAEDIAISIHHNDPHGTHACQVVFFFNHDMESCGNAYRAIERIYEMNRVQVDLGTNPTETYNKEQLQHIAVEDTIATISRYLSHQYSSQESYVKLKEIRDILKMAFNIKRK